MYFYIVIYLWEYLCCLILSTLQFILQINTQLFFSSSIYIYLSIYLSVHLSLSLSLYIYIYIYIYIYCSGLLLSLVHFVSW